MDFISMLFFQYVKLNVKFQACGWEEENYTVIRELQTYLVSNAVADKKCNHIEFTNPANSDKNESLSFAKCAE